MGCSCATSQTNRSNSSAYGHVPATPCLDGDWLKAAQSRALAAGFKTPQLEPADTCRKGRLVASARHCGTQVSRTSFFPRANGFKQGGTARSEKEPKNRLPRSLTHAGSIKTGGMSSGLAAARDRQGYHKCCRPKSFGRPDTVHAKTQDSCSTLAECCFLSTNAVVT